MKKRFADIGIKRKSFLEKLEKPEKKDFHFEKKVFAKPEKKSFFQKNKKIFKFLFIVLIFSFFFYLFSLFYQKVEITIKTKPQQFSFEDKIKADTKISEIDFSQKIIPAKLLEFESELSESFPCTGQILKKAEGKIKLYNAYTTENETWREKTRFISSEGKVFVSKDKIFVPGAKMKEGKLEPSVVEVPVIAIEGGENYNIGPSKFSVLAFKGSERFFKYWGESTESMKGGGKGGALLKEDIENAKKSFERKIEEKIKNILKDKGGPEKFLPENCFSFSISEESFSKKEGEACENFDMKAKVKIKALFLEKSDINSLGEGLISLKFGDKRKFFEKEIKLNCEGKDFDKGVFSLNLKLNGKSNQDFDVNDLKRKIVGKSIRETKATLQDMNVEAKIKIFPRFLMKIPENFDKIKIEIETLE